MPPARARAHRVAVQEEPASFVAAPDYADAFEIERDPSDPHSAEDWARDGFDGLPMRSRRAGLLALAASAGRRA